MGDAPASVKPVFVIDDGRLYREGLGHAFRKFDGEFLVVEAGSVAEVEDRLDEVPDKAPLVVLSGRRFSPDLCRCQDSLALLHDGGRNVDAIVICPNNGGECLGSAIDAGAKGFVPTDSSSEVLVASARLVAAGGTCLPISAYRHCAEAMPARNRSARIGDLTKKQKQVLALLCKGMSNREIAKRLGHEESTTKAHINHIMKRIGARNRTEAVVIAGRATEG